METVSCQKVAEYFLYLAETDAAGDLISNLKLQKLVYYSQGLHLGLYGVVLFPEKIEAWTHGPVVPTLYHLYKIHGFNALPSSKDFRVKQVKDKRSYLDEIYGFFGQYSAWKLRAMTHKESPWMETVRGQVIDTELMRRYFSWKLEIDPEYKFFEKLLWLQDNIESDLNPVKASHYPTLPIPILKNLYRTGEISEKAFYYLMKINLSKQEIEEEISKDILSSFKS